jgi:hypothetical protein
MGKMRNAYEILVRELGEERQFVRPKCGKKPSASIKCRECLD